MLSDIVWNRIALAKDGAGKDRNVHYRCNSGFCLRSLGWWKCSDVGKSVLINIYLTG